MCVGILICTWCACDDKHSLTETSIGGTEMFCVVNRLLSAVLAASSTLPSNPLKFAVEQSHAAQR